MTSNTWEYLTGSASVNSASNYSYPYPGGVNRHRMVIDSTDRYLYLFGGSGFNDTANGIQHELY